MIREQACDSHLVEVCTGFRGYPFQDPHILNEELASGLNLCQICTFPPDRPDNRKGQAISPSRVESRRIGIHTGNLSTGGQTVG